MRRPGGGFCAHVGLLFLLFLVPVEAEAQYSFSKIALTGEPTSAVPSFGGQPSSITYSSLVNPIIFGSGTVGFRGTIASGDEVLEGIWATRGSNLNLRTVAVENEVHTFLGLQLGTDHGERVFGDLKMFEDQFITFRTRLKGRGVTEDSDSLLAFWSERPNCSPVFHVDVREGSRTEAPPYAVVGDLFDTDDTVQETTYARFPLRDSPANADSSFGFSFVLITEGRTYGMHF